MRRDASREDTAQSERKAEYFLFEIWTGEISLNPLDKLAVWRRRFRACFEVSGKTTGATSDQFCPTGQISLLQRATLSTRHSGGREDGAGRVG
jgi:hypothetical protein